MSKRSFMVSVAILSAAPVYLISGGKARADDWGCKVVLCLSNPGGPTQYQECRPPIEKLWERLAEGRPFPPCNGTGLQISRPRYAPYFCDVGYRLTVRYGAHSGREAACVSNEPKHLPGDRCPDLHGAGNAFGHGECEGLDVVRPHVRSRPHFIDVTIDGAGHRRVWF